MAADVRKIIQELSDKFEKSSKIEIRTEQGIELKIQVLPNVTSAPDVPLYLKSGTPAVFRLERSGVPPRVYHSIEALAKAIAYETN